MFHPESRSPVLASQDRIERLRTTTQPPQKSASLLACEKRLRELRDERRLVADEHLAASLADWETAATRPSAASVSLAKKLDNIDAKIRSARSDLDGARAKFGLAFNEAIAPSMAAMTALLADLVGELDATAGLAVDLHNFAARNGLECPALTRTAPEFHSVVRQLRSILNA